MVQESNRANGTSVGVRGLVLLVGIWTTVVWMGTDMYLPALPQMDEALGATEGLVNITLLAFTLAGPVGAIVGGPISDKMGRFGPTLVGGLAFTLGNVACAFAPSRHYQEPIVNPAKFSQGKAPTPKKYRFSENDLVVVLAEDIDFKA